MTRSIFLLAAALALVGCAKSEEAEIVPIDESQDNVAGPVRAPIADERELSLGEWSQGMQDEERALLFGPAGTEPLFSLRCDGRTGVLLQRHGLVPTGTAEMMTITLGTTSQRLAVNPVAGTVPKLRAAIPASDELLAQLGAATMPIVVAVGDSAALNLPPSPLIGAFMRACATEAPAAAEPESAEPGNATAQPE